ncbi:MAG: hypothetical protein Q9165_006243 [Trypethelium subeluteriae]
MSRFISRHEQWLQYKHRGTDRGKTKSTQFRFPIQGGTAMGVRWMFHYTAVIVISRSGVSLSIIPEVPVFKNDEGIEQDDQTFYELGFAALQTTRHRRLDIGLQDLMGQGQILAAENGPQVFIFTPRENATALRWQRKIDQLSRNLQDLFDQAPEVVGYTVRTMEETTSARPTRARPYAGWGSRAIVEVNVNDDTLRIPPYRNTADTIWLGKWRLWLEDIVIREEIFCPF